MTYFHSREQYISSYYCSLCNSDQNSSDLHSFWYEPFFSFFQMLHLVLPITYTFLSIFLDRYPHTFLHILECRNSSVSFFVFAAQYQVQQWLSSFAVTFICKASSQRQPWVFHIAYLVLEFFSEHVVLRIWS